MEIVIILAILVVLAPVTIYILRSLNLLRTVPSSYYDFSVVFKDTKVWTVLLYLGIIAALTFVVLLFSALPLSRLSA